MFTAGIPYLFLAGSMGWCVIITCPNFSKIPPFPGSWPLPFWVCLAFSVMNHFSMQIQKVLGVKKKVIFFPSTCWPGSTQHQANAQVSVEERVGAKAGQNHPAQPALETHHWQMLDCTTWQKQEGRCFVHPSGCEGCFQSLKPMEDLHVHFSICFICHEQFKLGSHLEAKSLALYMGYCASHIFSVVAGDSEMKQTLPDLPGTQVSIQPSLLHPLGIWAASGLIFHSWTTPVAPPCLSAFPSKCHTTCHSQPYVP